MAAAVLQELAVELKVEPKFEIDSAGISKLFSLF